jgi:hypothetical protein
VVFDQDITFTFTLICSKQAAENSSMKIAGKLPESEACRAACFK